MKDRFSRIEATGAATAELADFLHISEEWLARWIVGALSAEEMDVIEVGLVMFALCGQGASSSAAATAAFS